MDIPHQLRQVAPEHAGPAARVGRRPGTAGVAYTAAWVTGFAVWPINLDVRSTDAAVLAAYRGHAVQAATQATLVHGVAALALSVVVVALARAGRAGGGTRASRVVLQAGLAAAGVSLIQWALDLTLATMVAPAGEAARAGATLEAINRLDGLKLVLLAALAAAGVTLARNAVLPRWLGVVATLLAVVILGSGIGYLLLIPALAALAYVSGPLLLVWVTGVGLRLGRQRRRQSAER